MRFLKTFDGDTKIFAITAIDLTRRKVRPIEQNLSSDDGWTLRTWPDRLGIS